jgi:hypothetical protein
MQKIEDTLILIYGVFLRYPLTFSTIFVLTACVLAFFLPYR